MPELASVTIALILVAGILCQWLAWRLRLPAIIFLLACGILAGPVLGWVNPDLLMGDLLFPFVSLSVAIILFEGSLTLKLRDIPGLERMIRNMITLGVLITWVIVAVAVRLLLDFSWEIAWLFGAVMVVTGPTVIMPMLRAVRPRESVAQVLQWEGILIDPIGAILAVLVFQCIVAGGVQGGMAAGGLVFGRILLIGVLFGIGAGHLLGLLLRKYWVPQYLQSVITLALVCGIFALSNLLEEESGLLSVTVMGLWLTNMKGVDLDNILNFKESLSLLLISVLFILLAARLDLAGFLALGWPALGVFAAIQFLARPLSVQACALGSRLSMPERHLLAWIAPRGIVAAAITAIFAIKLETLGHADAHQLVPLTFMVIIATVLLQSTTARFIARKLDVAEPEPRGFLLIGANAVAQAIGEALMENGCKVLLADQSWSLVRDAKLKGLPAYWGNPVSEHAERHLSRTGIGHLLALSTNIELNALATQYYRQEFEPRRIFSIRVRPRQEGRDAAKTAFRYGGRVLFDDEITYRDLEQRLRQGADIRRTTLTDEFSFKDYLADQSLRRLPLFAVDDADVVHVFTPDADFTPKAGWSILALSHETAQPEQAEPEPES